MIAATVEELTPIIGTRPACRALGASPATIYRRRRPPRAPAAPAAADARAGAAVPERQAVLDVLQRAVRRPVAGRDLRDAAGRGQLPLLGAHDVPDPRGESGGCASGATSSPTRHPRPELLAKRPNELWSWDITKLLGPAEVDVLLPVRDPRRLQPLRRRLDGAHRESAQLAKELIEEATEQQQIGPEAHAARRPWGPMSTKPVALLLADLGVTKTHSPPVHLQRQPLLRVGLQDAQVPARVPRALRQHRARPRPRRPVLRLVQQRSTATPGSG